MSTAGKRNLQLDVLRGIAILLVLGRHLELPRPDGLVGFFANLWFTIGWLGVDLFFVLSGFLIGGLLLFEHRANGRMDVGRFLIRRGLKIYPPYFVFIAYLVLMPTAKALIGEGDVWATVTTQASSYWPNLLFLQNYVGRNPAAHTWTLAVEEHFYLLLPFGLLVLATANRMRWLVPLCLFAIPAIVLALRCLSVWTADEHSTRMAATHLRLDALLFGVGLRGWSLSYPERFAAMRRWRHGLVVAGVLFWLPNYFVQSSTPFIRTVGLTWTFMGAAAFLIAAIHTHATDFRWSKRLVSAIARVLAGVGVYSYAIYLWHVTASGILERVIARRVYAVAGESQSLAWLVSALLLSTGAIVVGIVAARVVEWPVLSLRDRLFPSRSGLRSTAAGNEKSAASTQVVSNTTAENPIPREFHVTVTDQKQSTSDPLVSVGLPVYNGANYLRQAAACVLDQTYRNIELIISDNASTDETFRICDELAARDPRVRVYRNEKNVGAAGNYNQAFRLARGVYFKWAAHDDVLAPTFIARAVAILESDPSVVLCSSRTGRINEDNAVTGAYPSDAAWDDASAARRFESLVFTRHACVIVFGLVRHAALVGTPLIAPYVTSDRVLLAELGLRGRIREIPEDLFFRRDHAGSSLRTFPDHRQRIVWFDPSRSASFSFPEWNEVFGYASAVSRASIDATERIRCWRTVTRLAMTRWRPLLADFKYAALGLVARRSE